ncbi:hypothetical protein PGT21_011025 [Puccinia graminis f. sp. tritici]|uniref:Uncharacterized protein n=1 Tax=Puccinia graminis f. sp. tritici TaxID=56615 RepID=A0A5B0NHL7_PUCGR|nr:hypothetical protein PGTUg99_002103 [Puccinia graminis f. sp. tritici]KAA1096273.1 hypothetical protein PGT21_011025 [Puccinia graminis f. sp. tritici]
MQPLLWLSSPMFNFQSCADIPFHKEQRVPPLPNSAASISLSADPATKSSN